MLAIEWLKTRMEDERIALGLDSGKHRSLCTLSGAISEEFPAMGEEDQGIFLIWI